MTYSFSFIFSTEVDKHTFCMIHVQYMYMYMYYECIIHVTLSLYILTRSVSNSLYRFMGVVSIRPAVLAALDLLKFSELGTEMRA